MGYSDIEVFSKILTERNNADKAANYQPTSAAIWSDSKELGYRMSLSDKEIKSALVSSYIRAGDFIGALKIQIFYRMMFNK